MIYHITTHTHINVLHYNISYYSLVYVILHYNISFADGEDRDPGDPE